MEALRSTKLNSILQQSTSNTEGDRCVNLFAFANRSLESTNTNAIHLDWATITNEHSKDLSDPITLESNRPIQLAVDSSHLNIFLSRFGAFHNKQNWRSLRNFHELNCEVETSISFIDKVEVPKLTNNFLIALENLIDKRASFIADTFLVIADTLLVRIKELEKRGRKQEAIKETHKVLDRLLSTGSFDLVDLLLEQVSKRRLSLPILVAFLAATKRFKDELLNRDLVFKTAEQKAVQEMGIEKFNKSIFSMLK